MPTILRAAKTTSELNDILELRYRALNENGSRLGRFFEFTQKVIDHYDVYPSTINVIAYGADLPVASIRAVEYYPNEKMQNVCFDFKETHSNLQGTCYLIDMLTVVKKMGSHVVLQKQLLRTLLGLMARRGVRYAFFLCPVEWIPLGKEIGFQERADAFHSSVLNHDVQPMILELNLFYEDFLKGIADKEIIRFQDVFYMSIFDPGEVLVVEGEKGSTAYLIEDGEVEVLIRSGEALIPISTIGKGRLIGEVAMVTNEVRTASLIAKTIISCISFDRTDFMKLMYAEPHRSLDLFKIFSKRLNESNRRIAEMEK